MQINETKGTFDNAKKEGNLKEIIALVDLGVGLLLFLFRFVFLKQSTVLHKMAPGPTSIRKKKATHISNLPSNNVLLLVLYGLLVRDGRGCWSFRAEEMRGKQGWGERTEGEIIAPFGGGGGIGCISMHLPPWRMHQSMEFVAIVKPFNCGVSQGSTGSLVPF